MSDKLSHDRRILLVDDNPAIHQDFRRILSPDHSWTYHPYAGSSALFEYDGKPEKKEEFGFILDSCYQGEEALEKVKFACKEGSPFELAFVELRMKSGWDGLRTVNEIWKVDPDVQIVICTADSKNCFDEIQRSLAVRDRWIIIKKPFNLIEVQQVAHALTSKWELKKEANLRQGLLEQMLNTRTDQLSAALQTNSDFLNNVSHEMLTPMNGVLGYLDLIAESLPECEETEFVIEAKRCSEHLLRLINQVLAYNQAGTEDIQPLTSTVTLEEWLPHLLSDSLREQASERGLKLDAQVDPEFVSPVQFPANIVARVLIILIENAIRFTQSGSITVGVYLDNHDLEILHFKIVDTGVGLTEEQIESLNIPFSQVDSSLSRVNDGIGIGLPLARRLLNLIGSQLEFESLPNGGTCVTFNVMAKTQVGAFG